MNNEEQNLNNAKNPKLGISGVIKSVCIWKFRDECSFFKDGKCSLEKVHCDFKMQTVL